MALITTAPAGSQVRYSIRLFVAECIAHVILGPLGITAQGTRNRPSKRRSPSADFFNVSRWQLVSSVDAIRRSTYNPPLGCSTEQPARYTRALWRSRNDP